MPHAPQFAGSSFVSAQNDESPFVHIVSGAAHVVTHMLALHASPAAHVVPHAPQFLLSRLTSMHVEPHIICPFGQPTWASGVVLVAAVPHAARKRVMMIVACLI
jgi:hypothetical protein